MWKRWTTWVTLALLAWFNLVAWSIRTSPKSYTGVITLREHQVQAQGQTQAVTEYTTLGPSYFFGGTWFSYAVALFVGFGLPFILPRLVPWLWRHGKHFIQEKWATPAGRKTLLRLALLVVCNYLAWSFIKLPFADPDVPSLYHRQLDDATTLYTYLVPSVWIFGSKAASYLLAAFFGFGLPFILPPSVRWLWRLLWPQPGEARPTWNAIGGKKVGAILGTLALFVACNVVAWDLRASNDKDDLAIVLGDETTGDAWFGRHTLYYGIAPGVVASKMGVSLGLSFFVGEILPFLLLPALLRRRPPPALPLPPIAGAPR